jgi:hypothetical protein
MNKPFTYTDPIELKGICCSSLVLIVDEKELLFAPC